MRYSLGPLGHYIAQERGGTFYFDHAALDVSLLSEHIARVRFAPGGSFRPAHSWDVVRPIEDFPGIPFELVEESSSLLLRSASFSVRVARADGRLTWLTPVGQSFASDAAPLRWDSQGVRASKIIDPQEHFYGFGERTGLLDKSGRAMINWATDPAGPQGPGTDPMYMAIPLAVSMRPGLAYALYSNATGWSAFDLRQHRTLDYGALGSELDTFLLYGPTPDEVMQAIHDLLGAMPLPPRWALGYHQSRWSYESAEEVSRVAAEFRARDIPCDVIHLDIDHMDGYRVFTWNKQRFPDPAALIAALRDQGFHAVSIIDPGVKADPEYGVFREGVEKGMFIHLADGALAHGYVWPDDSVFSDYLRPEVRAWWGDLQGRLTDVGVSGVWDDMNEPTVFDRPFSAGGGGIGTLPPEALQGPAGEQVSHAEVHNLYGSSMAQATYEGLRRTLGDERPFVLTRSAFAGIQRWSTCWMGDNASWWEHLEMSLAQISNMGLSGVPFVGVDIGGFQGNANPELFARWIEIGALYPFSRGHSSRGTLPHEPWAFGPEVEDIARRSLKLRYRLLPYLYTLFWEASQKGIPVWQPLVYAFSDDPQTYGIVDEVLIGPGLLAAPVVRAGQTARNVYLPHGEWFDFWSGEAIQGPTNVLAEAPLDRLPLYVRAGTVLPLGPEMNYADERPLDPLTLEVYPGDGEFRLYEDDGHTFGYERGEFCTTSLRLSREGRTLSVEVGEREGRYRPPERRLVLRVHGAAVPSGPLPASGRYLPDERVLELEVPDRGRAQRWRFTLE